MDRPRVVGVDGWKGGWVAVALAGGEFEAVRTAPDLAAMTARFPDAVAFGVDMPIGFASNVPRRADLAARTFVGPRRSSVFATLPEAAYRAATHAEANAICLEMWGKGISQQAFALRDKVLEVAALRADDSRIFEVHPEVTFAAMAGAPLAWSKASWNGQFQRRSMLKEAGIRLPDDLGPSGLVPAADVLDAAGCAWTARRRVAGEAQTLPADPLPGEPIITY